MYEETIDDIIKEISLYILEMQRILKGFAQRPGEIKLKILITVKHKGKSKYRA
jgi:hypothetical protein